MTLFCRKNLADSKKLPIFAAEKKEEAERHIINCEDSDTERMVGILCFFDD